MRTRMISLVALLLLQTTQGQITIQKTDLQKIFTPGATITMYADTAHTVNVGRKGGPNIYDLSSLAFKDSSVMSMFTVAQVPSLGARFDPAGMVWGSSVQDIQGSPVLVYGASGLVQPGNVRISPTSQTFRYHTPNSLLLMYPATYPMQWGTSGSGLGVESTYVNNTLTNATKGWNSAESSLVDGYGTLIVRGRSYQCIRRRSFEPDPYTFKGFDFFTKDGLLLTIGARKGQNDTGSIAIESVDIITGNAVTKVTERVTSPDDITLSQNYPDPFNPSTTIEFTLPSSAFTTLTVHDLLGREVAVLVRSALEAGRHVIRWDAAGLSSGVYFYRLQSRNSILTRHAVVMR